MFISFIMPCLLMAVLRTMSLGLFLAGTTFFCLNNTPHLLPRSLTVKLWVVEARGLSARPDSRPEREVSGLGSCAG